MSEKTKIWAAFGFIALMVGSWTLWGWQAAVFAFGALTCLEFCLMKVLACAVVIAEAASKSRG